MTEAPKIGDVLISRSPHTLARQIRVTKVTTECFEADVLEGENTVDPITVYRAGWHLYTKEK